MNVKQKQFIIELEKLTRKYKIKIDGCGCCGSPWIDYLEDEELHNDAGYYVNKGGSQMMWISENDSYDWGKYSSEIIKDAKEDLFDE